MNTGHQRAPRWPQLPLRASRIIAAKDLIDAARRSGEVGRPEVNGTEQGDGLAFCEPLSQPSIAIRSDQQ
ncbi:unnamed protein product [Tilletia controversa]|nr:unnamed protein product [Tilletia controversa]CAD6949439.1 unnamed protein product [Tilletia controversa]